MTAAVVLRPLDHDDLEPVAAIEAEGSPDPWPRSLFAAELEVAPARRHWLVAVAGAEGPVIGFGGVMYTADEAHLMNLGVRPGWRGRRIAQLLCCGLVDEARRRGAAGLTLEVRASNGPAIALYEKLTMRPAGRRVRYYPDGEDAVIYWLHGLDRSAVGALVDRLRSEAAGVRA
ncbi:MAG: ribosomal protein S18-alanine N-acetyltransferase [Acidimicrobiales bacterium]